MSNDNMKPEPTKRGFPGGFFLFLLAAILIILTVQNLNSEKAAKVSFSHQLEHLVNLDLIQKEDNRKIALNDNLVTFSGKFKDKQSDEAKAKYRYLELLNRNHELTGEQKQLDQDLLTSRQSVKDSSALFLQLTGQPIAKGGFLVVDPIYNTATQDYAVVVKGLSDKETTSLADLEKLFPSISQDPKPDAVDAYGKDLLTLIERFRSPALGIGNEAMKQQLKTLEQEVAQVSSLTSEQSIPEKISAYRNALTALDGIVADLNKDQQNVRLVQLRSVRSYKAQLEQSAYVNEELEKNDAQLDKARQAVANVTWFFNNQELSTRALEKQDPEVYGHWFGGAKQEWENFASNKGALFKAPDQPRNTVLEKTFKSEEPSPNYFSYLLTILPVALVVLLLYFVFSRQMKGVGNNAMNFGKSPAKMLTKERNKVTFKDVAGCDEAKE
jgi:cell division protease FtsH